MFNSASARSKPATIEGNEDSKPITPEESKNTGQEDAKYSGQEDAKPAANDDSKSQVTDDKQNSKRQEPAKGEDSHSEKLSLIEQVSKAVSEIVVMESHDNAECLNILKRLSQFYWNHKSQRSQIAEQFVKNDLSELLVKMLISFNTVGLFKNDDVWFTSYYTMNLAWNYSDASAHFAKDLVKHKIIPFLAGNIAHQPYLDTISSKNVYYVLKSSLSVLQNISRAIDTPEEFEMFDKSDIKDKLRANFLSSDDDFLRTLSTMILTAIISEKENKMLDDTGSISFMVKVLCKALNNTKTRRHKGFAPIELIECICRMSVNDKNKIKIVDEGALPHLVLMMQYDDVQEQAIAAKTVWNLCFEASLRERITSEPGMSEVLDVLKNSPDKSVHKYSCGALWTLNEADREVGTGQSSEGGPVTDHVFLSYTWSNQDTVRQINSALKASGFRTWVDFEQMGGSTLEAMANAIENAAVVVICASEKYKQSPNCRTEAEYTFQIKKPILPLMMQRGYKPDGWLGMLLGAKFYVNFDGKYEFDVAYPMLFKELAGRGRDTVPDGPPLVIQPQVAPVTGAAPPTFSTNHNDSVREWTKQQVEEFFDKESLQSMKSHFESFDGPMLASLRAVRREAPEFFYRCLQEKMFLDLTEILRLISELDYLT